MNITNSILPSFLYGIDSSGITTTNRYVNVNGEDRPVVQKTVRGIPIDVYLNNNNSYTGVKNNVEYYPAYKLDEVTVKYDPKTNG